MAKKLKVNKSQAVRDYVKAHPGAKSSEIAEALTKKGIEISANFVATIRSKAKAKREARKAAATQTAAVPASPAPSVEATPLTKSSEALTLQHVKAVAQTVKTIGGFDRLNELLVVIKEVGGLKKFKDLLEAMAVTEPNYMPF